MMARKRTPERTDTFVMKTGDNKEMHSTVAYVPASDLRCLLERETR